MLKFLGEHPELQNADFINAVHLGNVTRAERLVKSLGAGLFEPRDQAPEETARKTAPYRELHELLIFYHMR
jgi:hypothetical protein